MTIWGAWTWLSDRFTRLIAAHPVVMLSGTLSLISCSILLTLIVTDLPTFDDPLIGFEARGTELANRINTWRLITGEHHQHNSELTIFPYEHRQGVERVHVPINLEEDEEEQEKLRLAELYRNKSKKARPKITANQSFCPRLTHQYTHFVVRARNDGNLLQLSNLLELCRLDKLLRLETSTNSELFNEGCETGSGEQCCYSWSLPNLVALAVNKSQCEHLTEEDINEFKELLTLCASVFYQKNLAAECTPELCPNAPNKCFVRNNLVYNVLHFLVEKRLLANPHQSQFPKISVTNVFLPLAKSANNLRYYEELLNSHISSDQIEIVAAEIGIKQALFEQLLVKDSKLLIFALLAVLLIQFSYTRSILVTFTYVLSIVATLGISYAIYTWAFDIHYFPFMNMMTLVILIGVGVDNTFVCCSAWHSLKTLKAQAHLDQESMFNLVRETFHISYKSTLATSLTTAAALLSNYSSSISATRCFSLFSATAVLVNFLINSLLLPCALVVDHRITCRSCNEIGGLKKKHLSSRKLFSTIFRYLFKLITVFRYAIIILGWLLAMASAFILYNQIKLPDSQQIRTFQPNHWFELYESHYKQLFAFSARYDESDEFFTGFPMTVVFGAKAIDTGTYTDPYDRGELLLDRNFDMTSANGQLWLQNFCQQIKDAPFYKPTFGPQLGNCFLDTFRSWMQDRPCINNVTDESQRPCCEESPFPFGPSVFNQCLKKAIALLHRTPTYVISLDAPGPRFSRESSKVAVAVIEYYTRFNHSSSYEQMHATVTQIDRFMHQALKDAPVGFQSAWFVNGYLDLYALQQALLHGTKIAIPFALFWAAICLILVTWDLRLALVALGTVMLTILFTISSLILIGWEVNVVESVVISSAAGMAVDFPLHFAIAVKKTTAGDQNKYGWQRTRDSAKRIAVPLGLAALTTGVAGLVMTFSQTLAYIQVGTFLTVISAYNYFFALIFMTALFLVIDGQKATRILLRTKSDTRMESLELNRYDLSLNH